MSEVAYQSKLACGHTHIGFKKVKVGKTLFCPLHGRVVVKEITEGEIKPYIGFVGK